MYLVYPLYQQRFIPYNFLVGLVERFICFKSVKKFFGKHGWNENVYKKLQQ